MPVALHTSTDDLAIKHVESGEERGLTVSLVVVGHGPGATPLQGQAGPGAVERLDLRLLVDAEDDGAGTPCLPQDVSDRVVALTLGDPPGETKRWTGRADDRTPTDRHLSSDPPLQRRGRPQMTTPFRMIGLFKYVPM